MSANSFNRTNRIGNIESNRNKTKDKICFTH